MDNSSIRILLVEDDPSFGSVLRDYLSMNDYSVDLCQSSEEGLSKFKEEIFNLCILDIMMPNMNGFDLAREMKSIRREVPIVFLTAKNLKEDVVQGYRIGADDFISKPFDTEVLLFKIRAILQRSEISDEKFHQMEFIFDGFKFNARLRQLTIFDETFRLSPKESELLRLLCIYKNDLMPRHVALDKIWRDNSYFTSRSMDVYIAKLRRYMENHPKIEISNIHGEGFRLSVLEDA